MTIECDWYPNPTEFATKQQEMNGIRQYSDSEVMNNKKGHKLPKRITSKEWDYDIDSEVMSNQTKDVVLG